MRREKGEGRRVKGRLNRQDAKDAKDEGRGERGEG